MPVPDPRAAVLAAGVALAGCTGGGETNQRSGRTDLAQSPAAQLPRSLELPDSLLFRLTSGGEVWWTIARESADSAGATCVERGLEVRRDATRVRVPLLYSADVPEVVDDTTIQVRLWTDCVPGRMYRVNVRTGQPTAVPIVEGGA
jgi:hypothetical protein